MPEILFFGIIFYLVYRLVFDLIVPVLRGTIKMRQHFGSMHSRYQQQQTPGGSSGAAPKARSEQPKPSRVGEYIDFEEVK
jgi:hypothetical protein